MSEQQHIQKKPLANELNQSEHKGFLTREFAEQIGQNIASEQSLQDIKTQLNRAERFGHNLNKMPVPTSPPPVAALQTKAPALGGANQAIQRAEDDDELQRKSASPAQLSTQSQPLQRKTSTGSVLKMNSGTLPIQHSTEPARDSGGSMLNEIRSIDNPNMDLNAYKSLNQHVESLLPKLQQQAMQQPIPGDTQSPMQFKGGGGGKKGGAKK